MVKIQIKKSLMESLLAYSKDQYPKEMLVLLRAKKRKDVLMLHQVVFAPFMDSGSNVATFNPYQVPIDSSIIGTAHSHPSGVGKPSLQDLLHMYGSLMVIVSYPFNGTRDVSVFNQKGDLQEWELVEE